MSFICTKEIDNSLRCNGSRYVLHEEALNYKDTLFWVYLGVYVGLVLLAGLYTVHEFWKLIVEKEECNTLAQKGLNYVKERIF